MVYLIITYNIVINMPLYGILDGIHYTTVYNV